MQKKMEIDDLSFLSINSRGNEIHFLILDCSVNLNVFNFCPPINIPALVSTYILGPYNIEYLWSVHLLTVWTIFC